MKYSDFAIFICTHGRPKVQKTYKSLLQSGCTYPIYFVVDNLDSELQGYRELYGDSVLVFDKVRYAKQTDLVMPSDSLSGVLFARNFALDYAKEHGYNYIATLDDDLFQFDFRYEIKGHLVSTTMQHIDDVFTSILAYMKSSNIVATAFSSRFGYIGGANSNNIQKELLRDKLSSFYILDTQKSRKFFGIIREDDLYNWYYGMQGDLIFRFGNLSFNADPSNSHDSGVGMTNVYEGIGKISYWANFLVIPSRKMKYITADTNMKAVYGPFSPSIPTNKSLPKIISGRYKK